MEPREERVVLILADISGYTKFMVANQTAAVHGQVTITLLIETLLREVDIPLALPGGRLVMGNWVPNDPTSFVSQLLKISSAFTPPPPEGFVSPMTWGVDTHIIERFGKAGVPREKISMVKDIFYFKSPDSPTHFIESFERFYGPTMNAVEAAQKSGKVEELHKQLLELAKE